MPDQPSDDSLTANPTPHRSDRVDTPQQYPTWRDYAFSEIAEDERKRWS